jgi:hypothetical protein
MPWPGEAGLLFVLMSQLTMVTLGQLQSSFLKVKTKATGGIGHGDTGRCAAYLHFVHSCSILRIFIFFFLL